MVSSFSFLKKSKLTFKQTYPDLVPTKNNSVYIPRIYGFRIYKKKGSKFAEDEKTNSYEVTHYSEELLKKIRVKNHEKKHGGNGDEK